MSKPEVKWAVAAAQHVMQAQQLFQNMVTACGSEEAATTELAKHSPAAAGMLGSKTPIQRVIDRLFDEAPKLLGSDGEPRPDQAPALECTVHLGAGGEVTGSLSVTPEGTYRMLSQANTAGLPKEHPFHNRPMLVESFFGFDEIVAIAVMRDLTGEASAVAAGKSSIIQPS